MKLDSCIWFQEAEKDEKCCIVDKGSDKSYKVDKSWKNCIILDMYCWQAKSQKKLGEAKVGLLNL